MHCQWLVWRIGIVLLKFVKTGILCLQYCLNSKIHYGKCKWTKKYFKINGLIQDEANVWYNYLTNINSLYQDKNDSNSSLIMSQSLHSSQQHNNAIIYSAQVHWGTCLNGLGGELLTMWLVSQVGYWFCSSSLWLMR